jgi:hypothetical protein
MSVAYDLVADMAAYYRSGMAKGYLADMPSFVEDECLWGIVITLLPWMKRASKRSSLPLNPKYRHHQILKDLVEHSPAWGALFTVSQGELLLNSEILELEITRINELCIQAFNPRLMT